MSAFALVFQRSSGHGEDVLRIRKALGTMLHSMGRSTSDNAAVFAHPYLGLGYLSNLQSSSEQIQTVHDGRFGMFFCGRLDNRRELAHSVGLMREAGDAEVALRAYERWGCGVFERFLGPFIAVVHDVAKHRVVLARDALGERTAFYHSTEEWVFVAAQETAVLRAANLAEQLDEHTVAAYLGLSWPADGRTFFAGVQELMPGHYMVVEPTATDVIEFWRPDRVPEVRYPTDDAYVGHFRELLDTAVGRRGLTPQPAAVMMSGGLDSTSVAASLSRQLPTARQLTTASFVFDKFASCDERAYIAPLNQQHHARSIHVPVDDVWPLKAAAGQVVDPNRPDPNPYRLAHDRLYATVADAGFGAMLTGFFGDNLYTGYENWLRDLIGERRLLEAGRQVVRAGQRDGWPHLLTQPAVRRLAGAALHSIPYRRRRPRGRTNTPPWLRPAARHYLEMQPDWPGAAELSRRPWQARSIMSLSAMSSLLSEQRSAARFGLTLHHPYRDRRIAEFMLAVPAHLLERDGWSKFILRRAMQNDLPVSVRELRLQPYSLAAFFRYGMGVKEAATVEKLVNDDDAIWQEFVDPAYVPTEVASIAERLPIISDQEGALLWRCVSFELWRQRRNDGKLDAIEAEPRFASNVLSETGAFAPAGPSWGR